ncbi:MAG: hypothetical protein ACO3U0_07980 [Ilumatobacteraceae bacterium]
MLIALVHLLAATTMAGLIWFVQVVHYPLFAHVPASASAAYAERHQRLTARVVGAPMAVEGVCALWLFFAPPAGVGRLLPFVAGLVLAVVLGSTVMLQVPRHSRLADSGNAHEISEVVTSLVTTNWVRTIGWSTRAVLAAVMVAQVAQ